MVELALGSALAAIGAGLAVGLAGLGLGQGIAAAGSVGAVAENRDTFARGFVFKVVPETQAIYGFLIAILLMVFGGILS